MGSTFKRLLAIYGCYVLLTEILYFGVFWSDDNPQTYYGVRLVALALSIVLWGMPKYIARRVLTKL